MLALRPYMVDDALGETVRARRRRRRRVFDVVCGAALPALCVILDPVVFRSSLLGFSILGRFALFGYLEVLAGIALLTVHLTRTRPSPLLAGGLMASALFSAALGLVLLPFSLLGMLVVLGVLGLTPFVSAFVFFRSARKAWSEAPGRSWAHLAAACAVFLATLAVPMLAQAGANALTNECVDRVLAGTSSPIDLVNLRVLRYTNELDGLVWGYAREQDPARRARISDVYRSVTGRSIEARLARLDD